MFVHLNDIATTQFGPSSPPRRKRELKWSLDYTPCEYGSSLRSWDQWTVQGIHA
ncbi:hypothetical protein BDZ91DRAFT_48202 [Kalaharituber pfeilii]|nr:hypothetical protein BDZ91DRAFT_48202 [Kalaharituber pfeilii]